MLISIRIILSEHWDTALSLAFCINYHSAMQREKKCFLWVMPTCVQSWKPEGKYADVGANTSIPLITLSTPISHLPPGQGLHCWFFQCLLHPAILWCGCLFWTGHPKAAYSQYHQGLATLGGALPLRCTLFQILSGLGENWVPFSLLGENVVSGILLKHCFAFSGGIF